MLAPGGSTATAAGDPTVTSDPVAHLHTHTEYSVLDGASRVKDLARAAAADGQPALAITDHGNMYGVLDFYEACRAEGVKPIIGIEAYMAARSRHDRPARRGSRVDDTGGDAAEGEKLYYHIILLAENAAGYRNLMRLSSDAYLDGGYFYKPRVDFELLDRYHEGLIATTGCLGGLVPQALARGDISSALEVAARLQDIFAPENLFVEVQDHGIAKQREIMPGLADISRELSAPLLATNDSHYTTKADAVAHDALLCVQTKATMSEEGRFKFEGTEHYLKSSEEMRRLFADVAGACDTTLEVASRCNVELSFGYDALPEFRVPDGTAGSTYQERAESYLRGLTLEGAGRRYGTPLPEEVTRRIDYELAVIFQMGFASYFLIVADLISYARAHGIRVGPGRGSAAGCCVAYCLGIVELDPIRYDLLFERFLNPGRKQMPDIDIDFDERYRGDMIAYAASRYGVDHVAQIITFSTIKARAAVRDAARVLGYPYSLGDRIAKAMPPLVMGRDTPLSACLEPEPGYEDGYAAAADLREMCEEEEDVARVVDVARGLEGLIRQDSVHAAAVVITKEPLTEYLPVQRKPGPGEDPERTPVVTQYEMHGVEKLGLLKMDFLGLRTLSVITRAIELIGRTVGTELDIDAIPLDDAAVFGMLQRGDSMGVFQLEGSAMRGLMRSLQPTSFDDVAALVALYRPGPMAANMHRDYADRKNGRAPVSYLHPDLEPILTDTYGLMIYQESVMRVAQRFAGYSLEEADNLRKACGKKDRALLAAEREKFISGCVATGYTSELGTSLFDIIEPFADYAFNKSHSYGYGLVAYQTAWLKAHYPVEYFCALLTSVKDDKDKTATYLAACSDMGIEVLVPDVNRSQADFTPLRAGEGEPAGGRILFGLAAVRNVGSGLVERIVAEREVGGEFSSFGDFCGRFDPSFMNQQTLQSLIYAGAFDAMGCSRKGLADAAENIADVAQQRRRDEEAGIGTLFSLVESGSGTGERPGDVPVSDEEMPLTEKLRLEKEMLGLYVSGHPLQAYGESFRSLGGTRVAELADLEAGGGRDDSFVEASGLITGLKPKRTKGGDRMATFTLDDMTGSVEVLAFPKSFAPVDGQLQEGSVVVVRGRLDVRDDEAKILASEIRIASLQEGPPVLHLEWSAEPVDPAAVNKLKELLVAYPGSERVVLSLGGSTFKLPAGYNVNSRRGLVAELKECFGQAVSVR